MQKSKIILSLAVTLPLIVLHGCTSVKFSNAPSPYVQPVSQALNAKNDRKLALILGGGGAKGMAHVGVLEELEKADIKPDLIVGCSAGAIVGGLYAANPDINSLKSLVLAGKKSDVIEMSTNHWPHSLYSQDKLAAYLENNIKQHDFNKLKIPFLVTATNLEFGNLTVFSEGNLIQPILASAALPGAFPPVQIQSQYFVDCGVADPIPVRVARDLGYKTIVAVNISESLPDSSPNHLFGVMKRSHEIAYINHCKYAMEGADVIISFNFKDIGIFTDEHNEYLYEAGKLETKKAISSIKKHLQNQASY